MNKLVVCKDLIKLVHAVHIARMDGDTLVLPKFRELQAAFEAGEEIAWLAQFYGRPIPEKGTEEYEALVAFGHDLADRLEPAAEILTQDGKLEEGIYIYHGVKGFKLATPEELER